MVIPVGERSLSKHQFYITALRIHKEIELLLLKDFGIKPIVRDLKTFMYKAKMSENDKELFKYLSNKYNIDVVTEYPLWIIDHYKARIIEKSDLLIDYITKAYTIYVTRESEFDYRRKLQWDAISTLEEIKQCFNNIISTGVLPININEISILIEKIEEELKHLRNWKKNCNKDLKVIKKV